MKPPNSIASYQNLRSPEIVYQYLLETIRTLHLATVADDGTPSASYAPFVQDQNGWFYIFTSRLSNHTQELLTNCQVSIMLIEDEQNASQIFARIRLSYNCNVEVVERADECYETILNTMEKRFGNIVEMLRSLPDFVLFQLKPTSGRLVMGFGQAFDLTGEKLQKFLPVKPKSS